MIFHVLFKAGALLSFLLCNLFSSNFVLNFVVVMMFVVMDFWTTKNVSGKSSILDLSWAVHYDSLGHTFCNNMLFGFRSSACWFAMVESNWWRRQKQMDVWIKAGNDHISFSTFVSGRLLLTKYQDQHGCAHCTRMLFEKLFNVCFSWRMTRSVFWTHLPITHQTWSNIL